MLVLLLLLLGGTLQLTLRTHDYWFNKDNPIARGSDADWNYCDLKCLYLEKYYPDKDFVVLVLTAPLRDTFAACYVKTSEGYTIWSKVVTNPFFEKYCGEDSQDWANMGDFQIKGVFGAGIGTEISENATYT